MQALKNMLSNSPNQQANNQANQKQPNSPGMPQSGNSRQPVRENPIRKRLTGLIRRGKESDTKQQQRAGSQQGSKELKKDQASKSRNAVPDRVALGPTGSKSKPACEWILDGGRAASAVRDVSPQAVAVTNRSGAGKYSGTLPLVYSALFEHPESGQK